MPGFSWEWGESLKGAPAPSAKRRVCGRVCMAAGTAWCLCPAIMQISRAGVPRCGFETKEPGSGASLSTGNPRPCRPACTAPPALVGWPWRRGRHAHGRAQRTSQFKVQRERGVGGNPGSLPGGSEFLEGMGGAESPAGATGCRSPAPSPAHLWETEAVREARPAPAACGTASSAPASASPGASAEVLTVGKEPLVRPSWKTSGRSPRHALQPRSPAVRGAGGAGRARGGAHMRPRGARRRTSSSPKTRVPPAPAASGRLALGSSVR